MFLKKKLGGDSPQSNEKNKKSTSKIRELFSPFRL